MLHKFTIEMKLEDVENSIELLNQNGFYNLYYDQPFLQEEDSYTEIQEPIELNIILEEHEVTDLELSKREIATILKLPEELIQYEMLDM